MSDKKDNIIQLPTPPNLEIARQKGIAEGTAIAEKLLEKPPTPQELLAVCRQATKHPMNDTVREALGRALELLTAHFGGDPTVYYADRARKAVGCQLLLSIHLHKNKDSS